jgi:hypothetical protein
MSDLIQDNFLVPMVVEQTGRGERAYDMIVLSLLVRRLMTISQILL